MTPSPVIVEPCTELVGPLVTSSRDPLEMFSYFFNENFLHMIVHETNLFAAQSLAAANRNTTWETSIDELKAYLGFMIVMGVNRLPEVRDYWSRDEKLHNTFIASRITRDRFEEISRYLHFVDNTTLPARDEPGYHRLQKVLPVISEMKQRCLEAYSPHPQNSIDEAMIPFKGRSSMKQYMPMKPVKRGFKVWVRADAVTGYFCDLDVYVGKPTDGTTTEVGLGESRPAAE
jgi:hypothetical protein